MTKKSFLLIVLILIIAAVSFAQSFATIPKNTVTADIGPTIIGLGIAGIGDMMADEGAEGLNTTGFGIGLQYERQLTEQLTVGGRFAYLGGGFGIGDTATEDGIEVKLELGLKFNSLSFEGHGRYYPMGDTFFIDGMLGLATFTMSFYGDLGAKDTNTGEKERVKVDFSATRTYFKLGSKIGWRICFGGNSGGFTFEPSFGYYAGIGLGDTLGKKLSDEIGEDVSDMDDLIGILENVIFIGGPRLSLSFGWRF